MYSRWINKYCWFATIFLLLVSGNAKRPSLRGNRQLMSASRVNDILESKRPRMSHDEDIQFISSPAVSEIIESKNGHNQGG